MKLLAINVDSAIPVSLNASVDSGQAHITGVQ